MLLRQEIERNIELNEDSWKRYEHIGAHMRYNEVPSERWRQVRYVPDTLKGWKKDGVEGTEEYGDEFDNSAAWAIKYDKISHTKVKIQSFDKTYIREYSKEQYQKSGS